MFSDRLPLALEQGLLTLPDDGLIGVFGVSASDDLDGLPQDRTEIVARHFPDHAHFSALGYRTEVRPTGPYALVIVVLPRAKDEARRMLADAARLTRDAIVVDGQKTTGIDSILKGLRAFADVGESLSKAHGKIAVIRNARLQDWAAAGDRIIDGQFHTSAGVFSADGVDPGSALLAAALPKSLKGHVVDLGAGWGYLSDAILTRDGVTRVDLVEADHAALELARQNVADPRAAFHWADARSYAEADRADHVVTNPPFHTGRTADASLGQAFIRRAAAILKPKGNLWLVANRHLPYEAVLKDAFNESRVLDETPSYKLFQATSPRRPRKG